MFVRVPTRAALAGALLLAWSGSALAQTLPGCEIIPASDTRKSYYQCQNGLQIELETGSSIVVPTGDATRLDKINLQQGGAWINLPAGSGNFQIDTPRLAAAVRGTEFAVTADPTESSVFVISGRVQVTQVSDGKSTELSAGVGITASDGTPFEPSRWSTSRVEQLNGRFGK